MEKQRLVLLDTRLGPWAEYLSAYTKLIKEQGYSPVSVQTQVKLIKRFSQWLRREHAAISALDEIVVERFLGRLQSAGSERRGDNATLYRFLHVLRDRGAAQRPKTACVSHQRLTTNYGRYLLEDRGLTQATVVNYVPFIDQFLAARFQKSPCKLSQLRARDVTDFVGIRFTSSVVGVRSCLSPPFDLFFVICDTKEQSRPI